MMNLDNYTSLGTWLALKPVYVPTVTTKDIEMCLCKLHLHARKAVNALIKLCKKQNIELDEIDDYDSFFTWLTRNCQKDECTYIS